MDGPHALSAPARGMLTSLPTVPADTFEVAAIHEDFTSASLSIPMLKNGASAVAASYRVLAHRLERGEAPQVVVVTGVQSRDGTTTVALNLAVAFAELYERPVLLVEANRSKPALGDGFRITIPDCFDEQLQRARAPGPMIWNTVGLCGKRLEMLAVEPGPGKGEPVPPWVLRRLFTQARRRYGNVIVDCPSVAGAGDLTILEDLADGALLVARGTRTRARNLRRALDFLSPSNLLGTVLLGGEV
jgi:Mrp family chromosome partitioning ATPase